MKKVLYLFVTIMILFLATTNMYAKEIISGYVLEVDKISDEHIRSNIMSLIIDNCDNEWCLYINNKKEVILNADSTTYDYLTKDNEVINIAIDLSDHRITLRYEKNQQYLFNAKIVLIVNENDNYIDFYPLSDRTNHTRLYGYISGSTYVFDEIDHEYQYQDKNGIIRYFPVNYRFVFDTNSNRLNVFYNEKTCSYEVNNEIIHQSVFFENFVAAHPLAIDYLAKDLPKRNFNDAKNLLYASSLIDKAVSNESITLYNNEYGQSYNVLLRQFITYWRRLSNGEYDTSTTDTIQTVCQWHEDACENVRQQYQESGRLYAVFGNDFVYEDIEKYDVLEPKIVLSTRYKNISWPDDKWVLGLTNNEITTAKQMKVNYGSWGDWTTFSTTDERVDCEDAFDCTYQQKLRYRQKTASWSNWSSYTTAYPSDCQDSDDCSWESVRYYSKRTASWLPYSSYTATYPSDCQDSYDCRWQSQRFYRSRSYSYSGTYSAWKSSCSVTNDYHCETYYKYTCKLNNVTNERFSTINYSINAQGPCSSGYKISTKQAGQRYRYIKWGTWSAYTTTSCSSVTGYTQCENQLRYATSYKSWSGWSGYNQTTCTANELTQCLGPLTHYRQRSRIWTNWSDYVYDQCSHNTDRQCQSQQQYSYRYRTWSGWSDWLNYDANIIKSDNVDVQYRSNQGVISWDKIKGNSDLIGEGYYYLEENKQVNDGIVLVNNEYVRLKLTSLDTMNDKTEALIMSLSNQIAIASQYQYLLKELLLSNDKVLFDDLFTHDLADNNEYYRNIFLNSELFIPYIYVLDHYRAVKRDVEKVNHNLNQIHNSGLILIDDKLIKASLMPQTIMQFQDNRVIYYNYLDPLHQYEELPANWQPHSVFIEELKNADLSIYDTRIILDKNDIQAIKDYLALDGYQKIGTCDILSQFAYLIEDSSGKFSHWLTNYKGSCENVSSY